MTLFLASSITGLAESLGLSTGFFRMVSGASLTGELSGAIIGRLIPGFLRSGYSGVSALNALRRAGLGIRTQTFYQMLRSGQRTQTNTAYATGLQPTDRLDASQYIEAPQYTARRYTAIVQFTYFDPLSGREETLTLQVAARPGWSQETVMNRGMQMLEDRYERPFAGWQSTITDASIIGLWDRGY